MSLLCFIRVLRVPHPRYLSEELHLNLSGEVVDSIDSMSKSCDDCLRMVRKLYFDFLISSSHDSNLLKVVHILSV